MLNFLLGYLMVSIVCIVVLVVLTIVAPYEEDL